jgi:hypothetical protein
LTLSNVSNIEMNQILQHLTTHLLFSLTIDTRGLTNKVVLSSIFPVIVQTNLQKLCLSNLDYRTIETPWPSQSTLEQLTIRDCSYHGYRTILCNSHHLRTLVIRNCSMDDVDQIASSYTVTVSNSAKRQRTSIDSSGTEN